MHNNHTDLEWQTFLLHQSLYFHQEQSSYFQLAWERENKNLSLQDASQSITIGYMWIVNSLDDALFNINICILNSISIDNFAILDQKSILGTLQKQNSLFV